MVTYVDERIVMGGREDERSERSFPWSVRGYRRSAVDQHIGELEREIRELDYELAELRAAATLREEVAHEMRRIGEETASVLIEAQNHRDEIVRAAQEEAHRLIAEASARATAITTESEARVRDLEAQCVSARQDRDRLLETALAASAAIADIVHEAHREVPPTAAAETSGVEPEAAVHAG